MQILCMFRDDACVREGIWDSHSSQIKRIFTLIRVQNCKCVLAQAIESCIHSSHGNCPHRETSLRKYRVPMFVAGEVNSQAW